MGDIDTSICSSICLQEAKAYAEENGLLFMETSAKTAMNVNEIFMAIGASCRTSSTNITNNTTFAHL